jgi:hypothetical protein
VKNYEGHQCGAWSPARSLARGRFPGARGPITAALFDRLAKAPHSFDPAALPDLDRLDIDPLSDDDLHLALYCCYELHYRAWPGVSEDWEWNPSLLAVRAILEAAFERRLGEVLGPIQTDEYGGGVAERMHASLFARTMEALGLAACSSPSPTWAPLSSLALGPSTWSRAGSVLPCSMLGSGTAARFWPATPSPPPRQPSIV